jgi:hypothetical protein
MEDSGSANQNTPDCSANGPPISALAFKSLNKHKDSTTATTFAFARAGRVCKTKTAQFSGISDTQSI